MFSNQGTRHEQVNIFSSGSRPRPISRLCVLRTEEYEVTAFWRPSSGLINLVEVSREKAV